MNLKRLHWIDLAALLTLTAMLVSMFYRCHAGGVDLETLLVGLGTVVFFGYFGTPWRFSRKMQPGSNVALAIASASLLVGIIFDFLLAYSITWTALLWTWLSRRLLKADQARVSRLLFITLFLFPWIDVDLQAVNWGMRLFAASASECVIGSAGVPVEREGSVLRIAGNTVEITESCGGGQTIHAIFVIGLAAAYVYQSQGPILLWTPWLFMIACLTNALRVLLVAVAVVNGFQEPYITWIHDVGGWLVIALMLWGTILVLPAGIRLLSTERLMQTFTFPGSSAATTGADSSHRGLLGLLITCILLGLVWRQLSSHSEPSRLQSVLEKSHSHKLSRAMELSKEELKVLGGAEYVRRVYTLGDREFLVTAIDGRKNRRAVHDPMYCWTVLGTVEQPLDHGYGKVVRIVEAGTEKEILYWFSDRNTQHASNLQYLMQASLYRVSLGMIGEEPLLLLVEPLDHKPVNWFRVTYQLPWLMEV